MEYSIAIHGVRQLIRCGVPYLDTTVILEPTYGIGGEPREAIEWGGG